MYYRYYICIWNVGACYCHYLFINFVTKVKKKTGTKLSTISLWTSLNIIENDAPTFVYLEKKISFFFSKILVHFRKGRTDRRSFLLQITLVCFDMGCGYWKFSMYQILSPLSFFPPTPSSPPFIFQLFRIRWIFVFKLFLKTLN